MVEKYVEGTYSLDRRVFCRYPKETWGKLRVPLRETLPLYMRYQEGAVAWYNNDWSFGPIIEMHFYLKQQSSGLIISFIETGSPQEHEKKDIPYLLRDDPRGNHPGFLLKFQADNIPSLEEVLSLEKALNIQRLKEFVDHCEGLQLNL